MIPVGATVYIAPGVENVKYLETQIQGGHLLLGAYMMGKITRYTNGGDKIGIEFEFKIWADGKQASNHNTGKPGYCCYVPKEYVKQIPKNKVEYFRKNMATNAVGSYGGNYDRLAFRQSVEKEILKSWEASFPSLGTNGYPELPMISLFVSPVSCPPPPKKTPFKRGKRWYSNIIDEVSSNKGLSTPSWIERSLEYESYKRQKEQEQRAYERQYMQNPQYGLGYDPWGEPSEGLKSGQYGVFVGARRVGKSQMYRDAADFVKYYGLEMSEQVKSDRVMAMYTAMQATTLITPEQAGLPFSFDYSPWSFELELLNL